MTFFDIIYNVCSVLLTVLPWNKRYYTDHWIQLRTVYVRLVGAF